MLPTLRDRRQMHTSAVSDLATTHNEELTSETDFTITDPITNEDVSIDLIDDPDIYITICVVIITLSVPANALVIYMWSQDKLSYKCRAYATGLAVIDILACLVICPIFPFVRNKQETILIKSYFMFILFTVISYTSLLAVTAIDRVVAVFKPYSYHNYYGKQTGITFTVILLSACASILIGVGLGASKREKLAGMIFLVSFLIMLVSYIAIGCKLYQRYHKIATESVQPQPNTDSSVGHRYAKQTSVIKNKRLLATIKAFSSISLCFILSLSTYVVYLIGLDPPWYYFYVYFINHVSTPYIHFITIKTFRRDIRALFKCWKSNRMEWKHIAQSKFEQNNSDFIFLFHQNLDPKSFQCRFFYY